MINYEQVLEIEPYALAKKEKEQFLTECLGELTRHHYEKCPPYKRLLDAQEFDVNKIASYYDIPFLPVRLFKEFDLKSVDQEEIQKTMTSSGTTGQQVSKIYLDKDTAARQTKTLTKIVSSYIGKQRMPMIILDSSAVIKNRAMFSARGAGILGFSIFARDRFYALDENMQLDIEGMKAFLQKHEGEDLFLFGFTYMIWQHFYQELIRTGYRPDLSRGTLVHGGGWKKLVSKAVSPERFREELQNVSGLKNIYDYYGMVEQTGTIYMECECGHLHTSVFSDVIVRRPRDFSIADIGETGMIETVSILPTSYPGHVLLTEDEGEILGEDDCPCGRKGKYFKIHGRIQNAEIRGCSDTYERPQR